MPIIASNVPNEVVLMNTNAPFFKELSYSFFRLLALIGFAVGATILACLLIGLSGCTIKYIQPPITVVDTVQVYLPEENLRYDSRKGLKALYERAIGGERDAYTAYIQNRYWIADKILNQSKPSSDFKLRTIGQIVGTYDTLAVRYVWPNGDIRTARLIPENDSWREESVPEENK